MMGWVSLLTRMHFGLEICLQSFWVLWFFRRTKKLLAGSILKKISRVREELVQNGVI
jgi:hypothetical protein